eukprot:g6462.t1
MEDFDIRSRYGSFESVLSHHRTRPIALSNTLSSVATISLKFQRLPMLPELSSSPCRSLSPESCSFTLHGAPRSFESIDSDNSERPQGQWYEFLQNFDSLESDDSQNSSQDIINKQEHSRSSQGAEDHAPEHRNIPMDNNAPGSDEIECTSMLESNDKNKKLRVDPSDPIRASIGTRSVEVTNLTTVAEELAMPNQRINSPVLMENVQEAAESSTSQTPILPTRNWVRPMSLESTEASNTTREVESAAPANPWLLTDQSSTDICYQHHSIIECEIRSPDQSSSGRKNAGRRKEKRTRSSPQSCIPSPSRSCEITEIEEEPEGTMMTEIPQSYTYRRFPCKFRSCEADFLSEVLSWDQTESSHGPSLHQDDSARANIDSTNQFDVIVSSSPTFPDEPEPDSALSFETRMTEVQRTSERCRDSSKTKKRGFVRKVAGVSDGRRLRPVGGRESKDKERKTNIEHSQERTFLHSLGSK